ncbi:uncharacterized protein LOC142777289 [Rhipicephalus microplus]|uniref:uncharacterized protein LOC142777289 n=1 Tax=Rhipicephalus microplus TaxID=6941 RepID=UPI003F6B6467
MASVVKREAPEAPSGLSTEYLKRRKQGTESDLQRFIKSARKPVNEPQWPSWWSYISKRQSQEKQKKPKTEPAAGKSESNGCPKPVAIKNEKPKQTADDGFDTWYRCDLCDKLFAKKLELEWHLREHTGVPPILCGLCPMKFLNGRLRTAHHTRHHGLNSKWKRFDCD